MERVAVLCDGPEVDASFFQLLLPEHASGAPVEESPHESLLLGPAVEEFERKIILRALSAANDNKLQAARFLGVSERTLWYKLKRYGL
jgi:two-component system response regulator AtoC